MNDNERMISREYIRRLTHHTIRLLVCATLISSSVYAQPTPPVNDSLYLNLEQLFALGTKANLQLTADRLQEQAAYERSRTARTDRLPDITVGLRAGVLGQPVVFERGLSHATRPESPDWQQNYALDVDQPLYHGGRIRYAIRQADIEKEIACLQTAADEADVKLTLLQHYLELFSLYKQHDVLTRNIAESERRLQDIRRLKREGLITNNDVLRSEMQLTDDRLSLLETENNIRLASQQLDILLGLDEGLLLCPDTLLLRTDYTVEACDDYIRQAYWGDPSMQLLQQQTKLAQNHIRQVRAEQLPRLSLYASNTLARPVSRTLADMYNNSWNVGLSLSYSLDALYSRRHRLNEADRQLDLRRNAEVQQQQYLRHTVRTAYLKHEEALRRVEALRLSVRQAEENYRIMRNRYLNQLAILTDLLDADRLRLNAELQLTTARTDVIYTYYQLQRAVGKI